MSPCPWGRDAHYPRAALGVITAALLVTGMCSRDGRAGEGAGEPGPRVGVPGAPSQLAFAARASRLPGGGWSGVGPGGEHLTGGGSNPDVEEPPTPNLGRWRPLRSLVFLLRKTLVLTTAEEGSPRKAGQVVHHCDGSGTCRQA